MFRYIKELFGEIGKLLLFLFRHWYITIPALLLLLLLPTVFRWLRVIFSNLYYSVRLRRLCRKKHFSLRRRGFGFEMKDETGIYRIRFLWRNVRKRNLYLFDRETAYINKPTAQLLVSKWFGHLGGWNGYNRTESALHKIRIATPGDTPCILIVNPAPIDVYLYSGNTYRPTGSGTQLQDTTVYFGSDFLHYLSRKDCKTRK